MKKLDSIGRITIPKEIRIRNGYKTDDLFEIYERGDEVVLRAMKKNYTLNEMQMYIIRKLYNIVKDTDVLEESENTTLREICGFTDVACPNCGEPLYITADNSYKCMKCGE